jgi:hypothetical protein
MLRVHALMPEKHRLKNLLRRSQTVNIAKLLICLVSAQGLEPGDPPIKSQLALLANAIRASFQPPAES